MADMMFPPEYQAQIEAEERKRRMAQMLFQQSMGFKGAQSQGPVASRTPLFASLVNAGAGVFGALQDARASEGINKVKQQYQTDENADLAKLMALPEAEQAQQGALSKFSRSRELAKTIAERREKRAGAAAPILAQAGDVPGALNTLTSGNIPGSVAPPAKPRVDSLKRSDGTMVDVLTNTGPYGRETATTFPVSSTTTLNASLNGPADYKAIEENWSADLKGKVARADAAKTTFANTRSAVEALEAGARTGGIEGPKQALRELLQGFGIKTDANTPTQELSMALGNAVLEDARKLAPVTNEDLKYLEKLNGTIGTDPNALTKMLAYRASVAHKELSDYADFIGTREKSIEGIGTPELRDRMRLLLSGQKIGREVPSGFFGPKTFQIEIARNLKNQGYDIGKLNLPKEVRQDLERGVEFRVDTGAGFPAGKLPGVASPSAPKKGPKPASEMTQAERDAEAAELRKKLGIK